MESRRWIRGADLLFPRCRYRKAMVRFQRNQPRQNPPLASPTMTKKRLLLIASLPLVIVVTLGVLAMLPPRPGVTKANFDRIEKGMTRAEVEQIFGGKGEMARLHAIVDGNWGADDGSFAITEFLE